MKRGAGEGDFATDAAKLRDRREALARTQESLVRARKIRRRTYGPAGVVNTFALLGLIVVATGVPIYLAQRGVISAGTANWLIPTAVLSTYVIGLVFVLSWQLDLPGKPANPSLDPRAFDESGHRIAPAAVAHALNDVDRELRRTQLTLFAEERREYTEMPSTTRHLDLIIGGSLLGPLGVTAVVCSVLMLLGYETYDPTIWPSWTIFACGTGLLIAWRRRRARRQQTLWRALDRLGREINGRRLPSFDTAVDWMNRVWAAPHHPYDLFKGAIWGTLAASWRGYPVLVDVEPYGYTGEDITIEPRVLVYVAVAALAPPTPSPDGEASALVTSLQRAGFEAHLLNGAGLLARASQPTVKALRKNLEAIGGLAPVVRDLVRMAEAYRIDPAPPV